MPAAVDDLIKTWGPGFRHLVEVTPMLFFPGIVEVHAQLSSSSLEIKQS